MKASEFFIFTYKESPVEAEVISHTYMLKAGFIKKLGSGIYTFMPIGLRSLRKIEQIVRNEMNRAGAIELLMPVVQPAELWSETGRYEKMGAELLRFTDRHQHPFVLQPTSEEVVTDLARSELRSYKNLPQNLYQIQTKFRDERRPRFGILRSREFIMKDAYSFDKDREGAQKSYQIMAQAYRNIFDQMGLRYRAVAADSGAIGGDLSEEIQVLAQTGEDAIAFSPHSSYAANMEKATSLAPQTPRAVPSLPRSKIPTPGHSTCRQVAQLLNLPLQKTIKSIVLATEDGQSTASTLWLLLLRGDHTMNEVKVSKINGLNAGFRFATEQEIIEHFGCPPGYLGPWNLLKPVKVIADREVAVLHDWVCGANETDYHLVGMNWGRDVPEPDLVTDIREVVEGDLSPDGSGPLKIERGIEVGHIFYLGTKYSQAMNATFIDETGNPKWFEMGCYGIGITRILAATIEQNHDDKGIIWPIPLAPFHLVLCPIDWKRQESVQKASLELYQKLQALGIEVILDDRGERPGVMFADWELIGIPLRITIGHRNLSQGLYECVERRTGELQLMDTQASLDWVKQKVLGHSA